MDIKYPNRTEAGEHRIVDGLEMEWLDNGRIATYKLTKPTREVVEAYYNINIELMEISDRDTPEQLFITLHDISDPKMSLTPQMRSRLNDIAQRIKNGKTKHRSAVILQDTLFGTLFKIFGNLFSRSAQNTTQQFFTEKSKALEWLREAVLETKPESL